MRVVDFAYAKDSSIKRRRSWKTIRHRYQFLSVRNYISRFHRYMAQQDTGRQKVQNTDQVVYENFLNAR